MEKEKFIEELVQFENERKEQKLRGLNDYNLLTSVLSPYDEVHLHSGIIHSLFDPKGNHYRGSLFLKLFLETIDETEFFSNLSQVTAKKETDKIDISLTDGRRYIIIENKINAGDQENQIDRYVEQVQKKELLCSEDILVIYLSIDRKIPTSYSLGELTIRDTYGLYKNEEKVAKYKYVHYKDDILKWIESCKQEVQNNSNLWISLSQYESVVKQILGKSSSKLKQFDQIFTKNFQYIDTFYTIKDDEKFKFEFKEIYEELEKSFYRITKERFYKFLEIFCSDLLNDDPDLILGELYIFSDEPCFDLNYREIRFAIYLIPGKTISDANFFNLKSIALRPTKDWSYNDRGVYKKVEERGREFNKYLNKFGLDEYIVGDKNHKGKKVPRLNKPISFEKIFNYKISDQVPYDFQPIIDEINKIKGILKI